MIAYVTVGTNDINRARLFYSAFLIDLGYALTEDHGDLSFCLPRRAGQSQQMPDFYIKRPFNGAAATAGNGTMVAFEAKTPKEVRDLHAAALAAGGKDEGEPGFRDAYSNDFYVGYLRDPDGNKVAIFACDPAATA